MHKSKSILFVILLVAAIGCAQNRQEIVKEEIIEKPDQYRWVSSRGGLTVRSTPDISGEKVGAIPFGAEVLLISEEENYVELAGRKGRWTKISWFGPDGWVFGGFLSEEEVRTEN